MKLITKAIENGLEKQGDTSEMEMKDIIVIAKFFGGPGTWYLYDWDRDTRNAEFEGHPKRTDGLPERLWVFANLGDIACAECGTVLLSELESIKIPPFGMRIERDTSWTPRPLSEVIETIKNGGHL